MIRNPIAWCLWAVAALLAAFLGRSPFVQGLLVLVLINVWLAYRAGRATHVRIALALAAIPILFSVGLSRFGRHVMFALPSIPIIGGAWTWEALAYGATSGVALLLAVSVFRILQVTVRSADLLALLPPLFYRAGTVVALSISLAPKAVGSLQAIREARQIRGRRTEWRSTPALLVPLLLTTLEQALQYGESLDARGYGARRRSRYTPIPWTLGGRAVVATSLATAALLAVFPSTPYNPYDQLAPMSPSLTSVVAVLLLSAPAVLATLERG